MNMALVKLIVFVILGIVLLITSVLLFKWARDSNNAVDILFKASKIDDVTNKNMRYGWGTWIILGAQLLIALGIIIYGVMQYFSPVERIQEAVKTGDYRKLFSQRPFEQKSE